ncbi:5-aminopentanamidase [Candidatus Rhodobacter oscarellae]|uniref:5-aminopentanamidase n=1 Tax=Candidatus Rhodobacter oscarellae TaxID=1675527 RepID=A0A0J9E4W2_9RHOB|nr:carbon-nitrogen hydrolase family protein [Candidatus Rhodobacter lobularis]KMW57782.1 5-aminopentanamidase [Candidatus Rhodobacter lobularis]
MPQNDFRLALAQSPAELTGEAARFAWLEEVLSGMEPADLLLLPECFPTGYNIPNEIPALAQAPDGPWAQRMGQLAAQHGCAILYGYPERAGDTLFNAAQCIGPDGAALHHFRKLAIPPGIERGLYAPGAGAGVFAYRGLKIGVLICYDVEFPETVRHLALQGADLVLVPTALGARWPWIADVTAPVRAYENGIHLAYANHCGTENGVEFYGHSVIAGPHGRELARAGAAPGVIYATIDASLRDQFYADVPYLDDVKELAL